MTMDRNLQHHSKDPCLIQGKDEKSRRERGQGRLLPEVGALQALG